jgi:hypothetical protein
MKAFERELQGRWPQFALFSSERDTRIWSWKVSPNLVVFVTVQALERRDQFVVEVAWNETEEFPWGAFGKLTADQPEGRGRLVRLWERDPHEPVWDVAPGKTAAMSRDLDALREGNVMSFPADPPLDQTLPLVVPLARDAVDKFGEYGMRLFRLVAEARGVEWPGKQSDLAQRYASAWQGCCITGKWRHCPFSQKRF